MGPKANDKIKKGGWREKTQRRRTWKATQRWKQSLELCFPSEGRLRATPHSERQEDFSPRVFGGSVALVMP